MPSLSFPLRTSEVAYKLRGPLIMFTTTLRAWFAALFLLAVGLLPTLGQTNSPSTNAPSATAPAPIAVADIVTSAQVDLAKLKETSAQISPDTTAQAARDDLAASTSTIEKRLATEKHYAQLNPDLGTLQNSQTSWQNIASSLDTIQVHLSERVNLQHQLLSTLMTMSAKWNATLPAAKSAKAPDAMVQSAQQVQEQIAATTTALNENLKDLYSLQIDVAKQADRVKEGIEAVNKSIATAQAQLLQQNQPTLWDSAIFTHDGTSMVGRERASLGAQAAYLRSYLGPRIGAVLIHLFIFAILIAAFYWIRNVICERAQSDAHLREAERIFSAPLSTALLIALVASHWLYPQPESGRLLWSIIGALALAPTVIIVRRLVSAEMLPLLYAMVVAYIVDQVRNALLPDGALERFIFLAEIIGSCLFILGALRSKRLSASDGRDSVERLVRGYLHVAFFVFLAAGIASLLGYGQMAQLLGDNALKSSYLAVIFYAGVRILDALVLVILSLRPISTFGMVRHHHDVVYAKTASIIRWIVTAVWVLMALQLFTLRNPLWEQTKDFLAWKPLPIGGFSNLQVGAVLAFPITVWAAFALSRLIRFGLEEDVFPNLNLPRGIPYAISTMVHYTILVVGFFMALSAMGIDLGNYAVLAGAFGVGLGFGLQNIMNNFISGLILLFERPVKVGDTIQIDATTLGRVERIGIRASVILLTNGSELIMPNGNLISNPVTNWTLSNCERLIEIPLNVAPKTNVPRALDLLVAAAKAHSAVLKNPPPSALITGIAAASTSLKLRCWIDSEDTDWNKVTTDLSLAVQAALEKENIQLA